LEVDAKETNLLLEEIFSTKNEKNKNLLQGYKKVIIDLSNKLRREDS
jgi:hypothetical protein